MILRGFDRRWGLVEIDVQRDVANHIRSRLALLAAWNPFAPASGGAGSRLAHRETSSFCQKNGTLFLGRLEILRTKS